jgi:hypothetical protein
MVHRNSPSRSWCAFGTDAALTHASGSLQPRLPYQMILGGAGAADGSPPPDLFTLAVAVSHVVRTAIPCVSRSLCWNMQLLLRDASPRAMWHIILVCTQGWACLQFDQAVRFHTVLSLFPQYR